MVVIGTDILVDAMRGEARASALVEGLILGPENVAVSAITVMQLHDGIARSRMREREAERVQRALLGITTYAVGHAVAERAGALHAALASGGKPIGLPDLIIGATALHHGEAVATRNRREFERIPGLRVVTP